MPRRDLHTIAVELRAVGVRGRTLHGHAAVYGQDAELDDATVEQLAPGAFDVVLDDPATDARALWDHDTRMLLGRQGAGTLRLHADGDGLAYAVDLPRTSYAEDLIELVRRGDVTGASFAFVPGEVERGRTSDGRTRITHTSVAQLLDVSPVTYPAYRGATTALRSRVPVINDLRVRSQMIMLRHRVRREVRP